MRHFLREPCSPLNFDKVINQVMTEVSEIGDLSPIIGHSLGYSGGIKAEHALAPSTDIMGRVNPVSMAPISQLKNKSRTLDIRVLVRLVYALRGAVASNVTGRRSEAESDQPRKVAGMDEAIGGDAVASDRFKVAERLIKAM